MDMAFYNLQVLSYNYLIYFSQLHEIYFIIIEVEKAESGNLKTF